MALSGSCLTGRVRGCQGPSTRTRSTPTYSSQHMLRPPGQAKLASKAAICRCECGCVQRLSSLRTENIITVTNLMCSGYERSFSHTTCSCKAELNLRLSHSVETPGCWLCSSACGYLSRSIRCRALAGYGLGHDLWSQAQQQGDTAVSNNAGPMQAKQCRHLSVCCLVMTTFPRR